MNGRAVLSRTPLVVLSLSPDAFSTYVACPLAGLSSRKRHPSRPPLSILVNKFFKLRPPWDVVDFEELGRSTLFRS